MPAIVVDAPGKLILVGEHAVVYGAPAIAVPLQQVRAKASVRPNPTAPKGQIQIEAPDICLSRLLTDLPSDSPIVIAIQAVKDALEIDHFPAFTLRLTSTIPIASGLGSSAATAVAVIRAVSAFAGRPMTDEEVCSAAYRVEQRQHGTPSGIDNTVITYQQPVFFRRGQPLEVLQVKHPFLLLVADSGISSRTAVVVADVARLRDAQPAKYEQLFENIGLTVMQTREVIENGQLEHLGDLLSTNHMLLQQMTVSSPELDRLVTAALQAGALGAKLSGGGRGGNIIALVHPENSQTVTAALLQAGAVSVLSAPVTGV